MRNSFFLLLIVLVAGALACSGDDESSSSPLQPSPLAPAPAGAGLSASPVSLTAGAGDVPGISRIAPLPQGFNAYDARIEYQDGEVTLTFVPVDMPKMPNAAREYRNRAVTVWQCPVEPHHVGQTCGEPVFWDSFAFAGSPSRTFPLADCAGWLVIEADELSDDRYDGWRNAPLSCRTDEEGRTVADVDTGGGGAGWEESRFDPPVRGGAVVVVERPSAQSVVDAAIVAAGGLKPDLDPVSVAASTLFEGTEGSTGAEYSAASSDLTVATVAVTDNPQVVITPVAPGTATIAVTFLKTEAAVEFDVTVTLPSLWPLDLTATSGSRLVLNYPENGWSSGSCTYATFTLERGPRCVIAVSSSALSANWEFHLEYFRWGDSTGGPSGSTEVGCPGLTTIAWDGASGASGSRIDYSGVTPLSTYSDQRWLCMLRDFNLASGLIYASGKVRNAAWNAAAQRVSFEINLGSTLDGATVGIKLVDSITETPDPNTLPYIAGESETVSWTSFPLK